MNKPVALTQTEIMEALTLGIPLYTHPAKEQELLAEIEALKKQVVIWERSSKDRAIKLNICAIKVSELEKKLDTRTKELIGASFYEHDYKTMMSNNKPVAWIRSGDDQLSLVREKDDGYMIWKPLYTHPAELTDELENCRKKYIKLYGEYQEALLKLKFNNPLKQLTDGEIQEISHQYHYTYNPDYVGFAKAILRKAQEK